jgi:hypothetical protein
MSDIRRIHRVVVRIRLGCRPRVQCSTRKSLKILMRPAMVEKAPRTRRRVSEAGRSESSDQKGKSTQRRLEPWEAKSTEVALPTRACRSDDLRCRADTPKMPAIHALAGALGTVHCLPPPPSGSVPMCGIASLCFGDERQINFTGLGTTLRSRPMASACR